VCNGVGDFVLNNFAISEKVWNTDSSSYFLKKENVIASLTISTDKIGKIEQYFNQDMAGSFYRSALPGFAEKTLNTSLSTIKTFVERYNLYVTQTIDAIYAEFENVVTTANIILQISEKIAFLCGIWNGLVDFIGGILKFLAMIAATPYAIGANGHNIIELFDNFWAALQDPNLITNISNGIAKASESIKKYFQEQNSSDINSDKVAYAIGFGLAFIGTFYIPIANFTKIANFSKIGKTFIPARYLEEISAAVHKTGEVISKTGEISKGKYDEAILIAQKVVSLLQEGKDAIAKFLEEIAKAISDWFLKARKALRKRLERFNKKFTANLFEDGAYRSKKAQIISRSLDNIVSIVQDYELVIKDLENEVAAIYTKNGKFISDFTSGLPNKVTIEAFGLDLLDAIITHNHPTGSSLSGPDIISFLSVNLREIRAVCPDGSIFSFQRIGNILSKEERISLVKKVMTELSKYENVDAFYLSRLEGEIYIEELLKMKDRFKYTHYQ
jgi:hypothetical protein